MKRIEKFDFQGSQSSCSSVNVRAVIKPINGIKVVYELYPNYYFEVRMLLANSISAHVKLRL